MLCDLGDFPSIRQGIEEALESEDSNKRARLETGAEAKQEVPSEGHSLKGVLLGIGPERGWTAQEQALFASSGMRLVSMGRHVLRTDVACIAAIGIAGDRLRELMAEGRHSCAEMNEVIIEAPELEVPQPSS